VFGGLVTQTIRTIPGTDEGVVIVPHILDAIGEMRLAVTFPYITDDPSKAMIAVMDECLQMLTLACRLPMDACLNVAISINFGHQIDEISADNTLRGTCP
jgi:hypothetical protein